MPKFRVYGVVHGTKYLGCFEADTEEEAAEKGINENGFVSLCHHCSAECEDPEILDTAVEPMSDDEDAEEDE